MDLGNTGSGFGNAGWVPGNAAKAAERERALQMWRDVYRFYATFRDMEGTDEEWLRCADTAVTIDNLYFGDPLGRALLLSVYDWLSERQRLRWKQREEEGLAEGVRRDGPGAS